MKDERNLSDGAQMNHQQKKRILKICGFLCLAAGILFSLIGLIDFFSAFNGGGTPTLFFFCFIGFPLIGVGGSMLTFGYRQEILRYTKNESVPVFNEAGKEIAPGVTDIAAAVSKGMNGKDFASPTLRCSCGTVNEPGSKFCKSCGKPLTATCPHCGAEIPADSKFCTSCGTKL